MTASASPWLNVTSAAALAPLHAGLAMLLDEVGGDRPDDSLALRRGAGVVSRLHACAVYRPDCDVAASHSARCALQHVSEAAAISTAPDTGGPVYGGRHDQVQHHLRAASTWMDQVDIEHAGCLT